MKLIGRGELMATKEEIENILNDIKLRRSLWRLSTRQKNLETLSNLGIDSVAVFDIIYNVLTWQDYISGPEQDNHEPPIPGNIWKFGLTIEDVDCYLKFQDKPNRIVMWISIHEAQFPLEFPYK